MDSGLTLSEALLIASIPGIIAAILGYFLSLKIAAKNISQQVKEELEKEKTLLDEKIRRKREDRWWNLKFDTLTEFKKLISNSIVMIEDNRMGELIRELESMALQSLTLFEDKALGDSIFAATEFLNKPIEQVKEYQNLKEFGRQIGIAFEGMRDAVSSSNSE